nr:uncharacterized protein LOC104113416 isoform X8 [Nicotiana tomentosiformis]
MRLLLLLVSYLCNFSLFIAPLDRKWMANKNVTESVYRRRSDFLVVVSAPDSVDPFLWLWSWHSVSSFLARFLLYFCCSFFLFGLHFWAFLFSCGLYLKFTMG